MHTHVCKGDGPGLGAGACDRGWSQAAQAGVSKVLGRRRPWFLLLFKIQQRKEGCPSAGLAFQEGMGWLGQGGGSRSLPRPTRPRVAGLCPHSPSLSPAWRQHRQRQHLQGGLLRGHQQVSPGAPGTIFLLPQLTSSPSRPDPVYLYKLDAKHTSRGLPLAVHWLRLPASNAEGMGSIPDQGVDPTCRRAWPKS